MSLRDELLAIRERHGALTPAVVVDEARSPSHPLHDRFEWEDSVAGEAWRRHQAHELIQSVKIVYRDEKGREQHVRAFHAIRTAVDVTPVYEPVDVVLADTVMTKILLADMEREWRTLKRRYDQFAEFRVMVLKDLEVRV